MKPRSVITSLFVLVLAVAVGGGITWLVSDRSDDSDSLEHLGIEAGEVEAAAPSLPPVVVDMPPTDSEPVNDTVAAQLGASTPPSDPAKSIPEGEWNRRIKVTLTSADLSMRDKSQQLLEFANNDTEGATIDQRLEALDHGLNLLSDEDYREDALGLALRSDLPKELGETMLADLHDRDTELLIEACRQMSQVANHPLGEEARGIVGFFGAEDEEEAVR